MRSFQLFLHLREFLFQIIGLGFLYSQVVFLRLNCRLQVPNFGLQRFLGFHPHRIAFVQPVDQTFLRFDLVTQTVDIFPAGPDFRLRPFECRDECDSSFIG